MAHPSSLRSRAACVAAILFGLSTVACAEEQKTTGQRGVPGGGKAPAGANKKPGAARKGGGGAAGDEEEEIDPGPARPPIALDSKSFSRRRDPFHRFIGSDELVAEPDTPRAERKVKLASHAFEDLKLIAIVNSGRGIVPRALFLASDGKSKTIKQGEYFSSAEVLLAAVNRDYVEIEVVDDDLGSSLNLQRGERRAIYLRTD